MAVSISADVIRDILARLPVKDLLRFRCVSKFFRSIIDCPDFSKLHLFHSQNTQPHLYGVSDFFRFEQSQNMLFDISNIVDSVSVVMVNRPLDFEPKPFCEVEGSCNGLIALSLWSPKDGVQFMIWNPFTGKSKKLASSIPHNCRATTHGFGYDPKTDDYKLARIGLFHDSENNPNQVTLETAIYSLKTNSWKQGNCVSINSRIGFCCREIGVLSNNALHWMIHNEVNDRKIVAFDLVNEEFRYLPVCGHFQYHHWMKLSVLDGCLAMSFRHERCNHVWVMKKYGVKNSWTKVLSYLRSELRYCDNINPLAYSSRRDKFLLSCNSYLYWYDLNGKKFGRCSDSKGYLRTSKVRLFSGSLLAPDDLFDLKRKRTVLECNKETDEEMRRKMKQRRDCD